MSRNKNRPRRAIDPILRQIINRDCHVSMRNTEVIRHVISRLKNGYETFRSLPRGQRRELMRQCIHVHRQNRELYFDVMSGDVSGRIRRKLARKRRKQKEENS